MSEPLAHRVLLSHERVMTAALGARSRAQPSGVWLTAGLFAALVPAIWLGHRHAFWLVQQLPFDWMFAIGQYLPTIIPALTAWAAVILVLWLYSRACRWSYFRHFKRLGIPMEIEGLYEILPSGLRLTTDRITILLKWASIDTVERSILGSVITADQLTMLIPSGSFEGQIAERAFLAAILAKLSPSARERSAKAREFARTPAALSQ